MQGILAATFTMAGVMKLTQPKEKLARQLPWVADFSSGTVRFIGFSEILCGIGLIVPWLTGIAPILTPIASTGICAIMVLATNMVHLKKMEYRNIASNIILFFLGAFIAYQRFLEQDLR